MFDAFNSIIIWGAGSLGSTIQLYLPQGVSYFWDSNYSQYKSTVNGISILKPMTGQHEKENTLVIIAIGDKIIANNIFQLLKDNGYQHIIYGLEVIEQATLGKIKNARFQSQNTEKNSILLLGDSIMEGVNIQYIEAKIPVYNRGVSGITTTALLEYIGELISGISPCKIFLCIGTNDLAQYTSPRKIVNNIEKIITVIRKRLKGTSLHVISILPVHTGNQINHQAVFPRTNTLILETNALIQKIPNAKYINLHDQLLDAKKMLDIQYTTDGLHLNEHGYMKMLSVLHDFMG
jgi:lysophospholipase L1-like esterase